MKKLIVTVFTLIFIASCSKYEAKHEAEVSTEASADAAVSNAANPEVEGKIFKSNAMIEMKVVNVMKDAQQIEQNAIDLKGFVLNSELNNVTLDADEVSISDEQVKKMEKIQDIIDRLTGSVPADTSSNVSSADSLNTPPIKTTQANSFDFMGLFC